jgi:hypothetical protein
LVIFLTLTLAAFVQYNLILPLPKTRQFSLVKTEKIRCANKTKYLLIGRVKKLGIAQEVISTFKD